MRRATNPSKIGDMSRVNLVLEGDLRRLHKVRTSVGRPYAERTRRHFNPGGSKTWMGRSMGRFVKQLLGMGTILVAARPACRKSANYLSYG